MGKYQGYERYKRSGVEWLGEIPEHWEVKKLKFVATVQPSNVDKKTLPDEEPILLCNYSDVYNNEWITDEIDFMKASATKAEINKFSIDKGDVIITKDSESSNDIAVPALVVQDFEDVVCGYHLTQIKQKDLSGSFVFRLFQCTRFNAQFVVSANGVTRFGLPQRAVNDAFVGVPPLDEQESIAHFLDRKTSQIDILIAKKEALLEKLDEKRTALISHAVTKGLDPNVPMKDSGVEWLGDIPEHWNVKRLKFVLESQLVNGLFKKREHWGKGNLIVNVFDVYTESNIVDISSLDRVECDDDDLQRYSAKHGDFFFVRSSLKLEGIGKSASLLNPDESMVFECHLVRGRPDNQQIDPKLLISYLNCFQTRSLLISRANQVTMTTIDQSKLKDIHIPVAPLEEQQLIVKHLDKKTAEIDRQKAKVKEAIELLKEYRTALITNAVTGKIDVRQVANV